MDGWDDRFSHFGGKGKGIGRERKRGGELSR